MDITLPLEQMSTEEKIQAMEAIWDDLCKKADSLPRHPGIRMFWPKGKNRIKMAKMSLWIGLKRKSRSGIRFK